MVVLLMGGWVGWSRGGAGRRFVLVLELALLHFDVSCGGEVRRQVKVWDQGLAAQPDFEGAARRPYLAIADMLNMLRKLWVNKKGQYPASCSPVQAPVVKAGGG